ncbi:hypothetical protein A9D66_21565 [Xanthomonas citri pv. glycines str. 12-2]|nr:hypothetical protein A9D66_21565 [Xanthomonas citri pv. glycines str. 12-2]OLR76059.1 hypothetical protein BI311_11470 [Xanthomonas citri pv. citri]
MLRGGCLLQVPAAPSNAQYRRCTIATTHHRHNAPSPQRTIATTHHRHNAPSPQRKSPHRCGLLRFHVIDDAGINRPD